MLEQLIVDRNNRPRVSTCLNCGRCVWPVFIFGEPVRKNVRAGTSGVEWPKGLKTTTKNDRMKNG